MNGRLTRLLGLGIAAAVALALLAQCGTTGGQAPAGDAAAAWDVVYRVLQHPRCLNCHPAGDVPLQGEDSRPHAQNVQRGADGRGRFAMRCSACHQTANVPGPHMPPGAPSWHLPHPAVPLVFEGRSSAELCAQLRDPAHNGGRTPEQLLEHVAEDALVLWGWAPGDGREPVPIPHAELVAAMRTWVGAGCPVPQ